MTTDQRIYTQIIQSLVHLHTCRESVQLYRPEVRQLLKKAAGTLDRHLGKAIGDISGQLAGYISRERLETYIEDTSAVHMEVLNQVEKAKDKVELLAMIRAYNSGDFKLIDE